MHVISMPQFFIVSYQLTIDKQVKPQGHCDVFFMVTPPEGSLRILYCSFEIGHQGPHSTGGRDVPIYTAV